MVGKAAVQMNPYQYKISLRLRHPSANPADITSALGLSPFRCGRAGEPRSTPKGNPLEGKYTGSFWAAELAEGRWPGKTLENVISDTLGELAVHKTFFHQIRSEGGHVVFVVGWFFDGLSGGVFDCELLARMADLKIDLSLHVYPPDPT